jgi:uncharacterized damage-inducible protein DinB
MKTQTLLKTLDNSRNYTLAVAEAMPEKSYTFKPTESVFNFNELMNHIAYGIEWWRENFIQENKVDWNPPVVKGSKKEAIEYLNKAYTSLEKSIQNTQLSESAVHGFYTTLDHITHHRGQATTYLRCVNVAPPDYTY